MAHKDRGGTAPKLPTQAELEHVLGLPTHHAVEIQDYVRRVDGMESAAEKAAAELEAVGGAFVVPGVTAEHIRDALAGAARLKPIEEALFPYYRRAYENRLEADSEVMRAILKIWRMVQASDDRNLRDRFAFLGEWISRHHAHGPRPVAPAPAHETRPV